MNWQEAYAHGWPYGEYLARHGTEAHRARWQTAYERATLTGAQRAFLAGFERQMHLLCLAGTWCGDCVREGAILQRIAEATPRIGLRFLDRDEHPKVAQELAINAGLRVPVVVFLSEDFAECARYGERTLATYRKMAAEGLGSAAKPPTLDEYYAAVIQDWLDEIERVQLLLRLSPRLRAKHGD